jgi:hypothetical protein
MRRKVSSKRRWLARFLLGKNIPETALMEHPDLRSRLTPAIANGLSQHIRRATDYEAAGGWSAHTRAAA